MATATVTRSKQNMRAQEYVLGMVKASRKTHWLVCSGAPKSVDDLSFTSRDEEGTINWWCITAPKTNYWDVHNALGRAYAFELLDLLHNPESTEDNTSATGCIITAIARWMPTVCGSAASGVADGFFSALSEFVATGTVDR